MLDNRFFSLGKVTIRLTLRAASIPLPVATDRRNFWFLHQTEGQSTFVSQGLSSSTSLGLRTSLGADVVMLTYDHAAQTGKVVFRPVDVLAVVTIHFAAVHAINVPAHM